jgi:hypothetical protein
MHDAQTSNPHGRCARKPRSAGDFYAHKDGKAYP